MKFLTRYFTRPAIKAYDEGDDVIEGALRYVGEVSILFGQAARSLGKPGNVLDAMVSIGVNSMPIALVTIVFSGMVLALYTAAQMEQQGLGQYVGGLVGLTMSRELAPVLAAVVVAARAGSSIAAEIGSMKVTEQVDALRSLATDPVQYLVVPRLVACVTMLPVLTLFGVVAGILGGYLVAAGQGMSRGLYFGSIQQFVVFSDVFIGCLKTTVFGAIIAIVACHQGLNTRGGASGVGNATTRSVVLCIVFIYAADFLITRILVGTIQ